MIRLRVVNTQNDETWSQNSLEYLSKADLRIAVTSELHGTLTARGGGDIYVYVYIYIYTYIYIYIYIYKYMCVCVCIYVNIYVYAFMYVFVYL